MTSAEYCRMGEFEDVGTVCGSVGGRGASGGKMEG